MRLLNLFPHNLLADKRQKIIISTIMIFCAVAVIIPGNAMAAPPTAKEVNTDKDLKEVRDKITASSERARQFEKQAKTLDTEISDLSQKLVTAARKIQQTEGDVYNAEDNLQTLNNQEKNLKDTLDTRFGQMAKTLAAMQRLSQQPPELVAYRPGKAINTLRTASLLKALQPELKHRAEIIEDGLEELKDVRQQITKERTELKELLSALTSEQIELNRLLSDRRQKQEKLRQATRDERQKLKQFAAQAKNLEDLIARIEREAQEREKAARAAALRLAEKPHSSKKSARLKLDSLPTGIKSFLQAKGTLPLPARGLIQRTFGAKTPEGQSSEGITIHTLPLATVVSPHEGRIVFAGKFRSYGQLLIIAHGQEYHTLLAGMTRLDAEVGQWVLKGEPIGQMAAGSAIASANGLPIGQNLYVELRRMGKPINPLPWIAARDRKVL